MVGFVPGHGLPAYSVNRMRHVHQIPESSAIMKKRRLSFLIVLAVLSANPAKAANYDVTTTSGNGAGSLPDAVGQANADAGQGGAVTVTFNSSGSGTIQLDDPLIISNGMSFVTTGTSVAISTGLTGAPVIVVNDGITLRGLSSSLALSSFNSDADNGDARGIYGAGKLSLSGTQASSISTSGFNRSSGIEAHGNLDVAGDLGGSITAGVNPGNPSSLMYSLGAGTTRGNATFGSVSATVNVESQIMAIGIGATTLGTGASSNNYGNLTITGDFSGRLVVTENSNAIGLDNDVWEAYGIVGDRTVTIGGQVTGSIEVDSVLGNAYGIMSNNSDVKLGGFGQTGSITTSGVDTSVGIRAVNGDVRIPGTMSGTITTFASGIAAVSEGIFADNNVLINTLSGTVDSSSEGGLTEGIEGGSITIETMSGKIISRSSSSTPLSNWSEGIFAHNTLHVSSLSGQIQSGRLNGGYADALYAHSVSIDDMGGGLNVSISGNGDVAEVYGIYAENDASVHNLGGTISAVTTMTGGGTAGSLAVGIYADQGTVAIDADSGTISARCVNGNAYGILSHSDVTIGSMSGSITASGSAGAYGISSTTGAVTFTGTISGSLTGTADAQGSMGAGILAYGDLSIPGLSGTIQGSGNYAFGIMSEAGGIHGSSAVSPMVVSGTINAQGATTGSMPGAAAAIISSGAMNLNITGTLRATVDGDVSKGYAIYGGTFDPATGFTPSSAGNNVSVSGNATIIGNISLGSGINTMSLSGNSNITQVHTLDGGSSGRNSLVLDGWGNATQEAELGHSAGDSIINWSTIELKNSSWVHLGRIAGFDVGTLSIDAGSVLDLHGNSPATYTINGNIVNNGIINMIDPAGTVDPLGDHLVVGGSYSGNGTIGIDVSPLQFGYGEHDTVSITGNASGTITFRFNDISSAGPFRNEKFLDLVTFGSGSTVTFAGNGEYDWGARVYNADVSYDSGVFTLFRLMPESFQEPVAVMQSVMPFLERHGNESLSRFHDRTWHGKDWWVRSYGSKYRLDISGEAGTQFKGYMGGIQLGVDLAASKPCEKCGWNAGVFAGSGYGQADISGFRTDNAGNLSDYTFSLGLYADSRVGDNLWVDSVVQASYHNLRMTFSDESLQIGRNFWGVTASIEAGCKVPVSDAFHLEPQAQFLWHRNPSIDVSTGIGDVVMNSHDGAYGRIGIFGLIGAKGSRTHLFAGVNAVRDFSSWTRVSYLRNDEMISTAPEKMFFGGSAGVRQDAANDGSGLSYFLKAELMAGVSGGASQSYGFSAGFSKSF